MEVVDFVNSYFHFVRIKTDIYSEKKKTIAAATETMSFSRNSRPQRGTMIKFNTIVINNDKKNALIMQSILVFGRSVIF